MIIDGDLEDPRVGSVTVTEVKVSQDLRNAKIYVSILGTKEEAAESLEALKHAAGFIRRMLGAVMRIKYTPELQFVYDDTDEKATRIEELLKEEVVKAQERERNEEQDQEPLEPGT